MNEQGYSTEWGKAWDIVWTLSQEGTITSAHASIEKLTGWPSSAWEGLALLDLVHAEDIPLVARQLRDVVSGHSMPPFDLRIRARGGANVVAEAAFTRLPDGGTPG